MIKNIYFDFDGTLADTTEGILSTFKATLRELNLPDYPDEEIVKTIGLPLHGNFRVVCGLEGEENERACETYRRLFPTESKGKITLYPGVKEALEELQKMGFRMAIASSRHTKSLVMLSDEMDISRFFLEMYGVDRSPKPKPAPDTVLALLEALDMKAEETLVVGDTIFDLQMGRSAGCQTCGVTYGNQDREMLQTENPEYLLDSMTELPGKLR